MCLCTARQCRRCASSGWHTSMVRGLPSPALSHGVHGPERSDATQSVSSLFCGLTMSSQGGWWPLSWRFRDSSSVHWGHSITALAGHMSPSVPVAVAGKRPCRSGAWERLKVSVLSSNAVLMNWLSHPDEGELPV